MKWTMAFSEALIYLKRGYYLRRTVWRKDRQCKLHDGHIFDCLYKQTTGFVLQLTSEDVLAHDWVVDEVNGVER